MKLNDLIWIDEIVDKLERKHSVAQDEVVELLQNSPKFRFVEKGHRKGENVYYAAGRTDSGRYLIVFFVHKSDRRALIISARDMTSSEKRKYAKK